MRSCGRRGLLHKEPSGVTLLRPEFRSPGDRTPAGGPVQEPAAHPRMNQPHFGPLRAALGRLSPTSVSLALSCRPGVLMYRARQNALIQPGHSAAEGVSDVLARKETRRWAPSRSCSVSGVELKPTDSRRDGANRSGHVPSVQRGPQPCRGMLDEQWQTCEPTTASSGCDSLLQNDTVTADHSDAWLLTQTCFAPFDLTECRRYNWWWLTAGRVVAVWRSTSD